jgi:transposase-like protein
MSKGSRRKFGEDFKFKVAISALKEQETLEELGQRYEIHPNMVLKWKKQLLEHGSRVFSSGPSTERGSNENQIKEYQAKIGELTMSLDFLKKKLVS